MCPFVRHSPNSYPNFPFPSVPLLSFSPSLLLLFPRHISFLFFGKDFRLKLNILKTNCVLLLGELYMGPDMVSLSPIGPLYARDATTSDFYKWVLFMHTL